MSNKDIFNNGKNEEIILSSIDAYVNSSEEDTYGLNAASKIDNNTGSDSLISEIERLSSENINIIYSTENIGDDTDILVSSPLLFNKTSTPEQLFGQQIIDFNKTDIDFLTGNNRNNPLVGTFELKPSIIDEVVAPPISTTAPTSKYAIRTEKQIRINNGGDLDGNPVDISDDALIYAAKGFRINGNVTLPIKRDENGNPLRDNFGKLILVDNAVTVASDYAGINAPNNQYSNLVPPQVVDEQVIDIPDTVLLKHQTLDSIIATDTETITFNAGQNPLRNSQQWTSKFPSPGTLDNPTVVRVTGGGLSIPNKVDLSNYVIIVENGNINFNGNQHNFENVILIAENGNINLSKIQATNLSAFASGSINMNRQSRYAGSTLLVTESNKGNINFNGATASTDSEDSLRVVSSGKINFNAASDTRGSFESVGDFTSKTNSTLYGTIAAKGFVNLRRGANVVYANDALTNEIDEEEIVINAALIKDANVNNADDLAISGTIKNESQIVSLKAAFKDTNIDNYIDATAWLQSDGSFSFDKPALEAIKGGILADDSYTLYLQAEDVEGNTSDVFELSFILDTAIQTYNPGFAIKTEGKLTINGGGDLDGDSSDLLDDARIYAAQGFKINGNINLPVKLNADGTSQLDVFGKKILKDNAVAVADGYTTSRGPDNQYAGLNPPQIVEQIAVDIPEYDSLKQQQLNSFIADNNKTITFDISDNKNNVRNANSWIKNFPAPGTVEDKTVVEIIGGGLTIPNRSKYSEAVTRGKIG
ncbi:MAG: hypothetical protein WBA07_01335 [Rivularia sp. (in: cyanobacteria)]